eukprot:gene12683-12813_t
MEVEAPGGLGLAAPSSAVAFTIGVAPLALQFNWPAKGFDLQTFIMPGAIDAATDGNLQQVANKAVQNSMAALQQQEGSTPSPRTAAIWDNTGAPAKKTADPIITPLLMLPHVNMVSWVAFVSISGNSPLGTGAFMAAHVVNNKGANNEILTPRLNPTNSLAVDAGDLKKMARFFGCKYNLQLLAEYNLAPLPLAPGPAMQQPARCIPFPMGSILEAVEKELNICLREPAISTAALIHAGLWELAKSRSDFDTEFSKWVGRCQRITQAAAAAHLGSMVPSAPPASPLSTTQLAALRLGSKRPSQQQQPVPKRACSPVLP